MGSQLWYSCWNENVLRSKITAIDERLGQTISLQRGDIATREHENNGLDADRVAIPALERAESRESVSSEISACLNSFRDSYNGLSSAEASERGLLREQVAALQQQLARCNQEQQRDRQHMLQQQRAFEMHMKETVQQYERHHQLQLQQLQLTVTNLQETVYQASNINIHRREATQPASTPVVSSTQRSPQREASLFRYGSEHGNSPSSGSSGGVGDSTINTNSNSSPTRFSPLMKMHFKPWRGNASLTNNGVSEESQRQEPPTIGMKHGNTIHVREHLSHDDVYINVRFGAITAAPGFIRNACQHSLRYACSYDPK